MRALRSNLLRLGGAVALLVAASYLLISHFSEPRHKGRSLTSWLREYDHDMADSGEAARAVRSIGTNAAPRLVRMLLSGQRPLFPWLAEKLSFPLRFDSDSGPNGAHRLATHGFRLLGPTASNALPSLLWFMTNSGRGYLVVEAINSIGEPALPSMETLLISTNYDAQRFAVMTILNVGRSNETVLQRLLAHSNHVVRGETYMFLPSRLPREEALPMLLKNVRDPHTYASQRAVLAIRSLGLYATNALPELYRLQATTNALLSREIAATIRNIEKRVRIEQSELSRGQSPAIPGTRPAGIPMP